MRERFGANRGNVLISMDDFEHLVVELVDKKHEISPAVRDHGHEGNIRNSYEMVRSKGELRPGCEISYVWETANLFLKTKQALEKDEVITLQPFARGVMQKQKGR